jgi:hypothetical protein
MKFTFDLENIRTYGDSLICIPIKVECDFEIDKRWCYEMEKFYAEKRATMFSPSAIRCFINGLLGNVDVIPRYPAINVPLDREPKIELILDTKNIVVDQEMLDVQKGILMELHSKTGIKERLSNSVKKTKAIEILKTLNG